MPVNIVVPEVGESIVDARVAKWLKKEGDSVAAGDPLVELETDKIDIEVPSPSAGVIKSVAHQDGADVKVGDVLGVIDETAQAAAPAAAPPAEEAKAAAKAAAGDSAKTRATPTARKAAEEKDVDLSKVKGSGDAGRVMRRDVEAASRPDASTKSSAEPATPASRAEAAVAKPPAAKAEREEGNRSEERIRMSKRRATIARRLVDLLPSS